MLKSVRLVLAVLVTCLAAATGLSLTYAVTAPRIAEQDRLAEERSLQAVLPTADDFEMMEDSTLLEASVAAADGATTVTLRQRSCGYPVAGLRRW
jgi:Na+-translocating ferredoxin:NAD+ oxidoreductase RnfG subunit